MKLPRFSAESATGHAHGVYGVRAGTLAAGLAGPPDGISAMVGGYHTITTLEKSMLAVGGEQAVGLPLSCSAYGPGFRYCFGTGDHENTYTCCDDGYVTVNGWPQCLGEGDTAPAA
jgi:hypothetical protein